MKRSVSNKPGLRSNKQRKVAVILNLWQNFDRGVMDGIAAYVRERRNWSVFVEEVKEQRIPDPHEWHGDGMIVNFDIRSVVESIKGTKKPVVALGGGLGWHDPKSGIPYVATDDVTIGRLAAEHLLDRGLKEFAYVGYPSTQTNIWVKGRAKGFTERLLKAGFSCRIFNGSSASAEHWGRVQKELVAWLKTLSTPIGLMGCYDWRARHVLEACRTAGLRVPDDVAVIGVDNDSVCDLADPPLTSVEQGRFQIGYTAAKVLDRMMSGNKSGRKRYIIPPVGVVSRQSTDLVYVNDREVAAALSMIREQACQGLQVESVAEQLHLSRSTMDKRFKSSIGRTVDAEIRRVRLERAKELLTRTNLPIREIARQSGYATEQYLAAVMRKSAKVTPVDYRRLHQSREQ